MITHLSEGSLEQSRLPDGSETLDSIDEFSNTELVDDHAD